MGSIDDSVPFQVLDDVEPENTSLPAFMVSTSRGFLPRMNPIVKLPAEFDALESILQRMPVKTASGEPGLLAACKLGREVEEEFPDLTASVEDHRDNLPLINALYRDYSFLASAYLLEPCHERFVKGESYGLARSVLPSQVALPISRCAEICGFKPFMEYAGSYALFNFKLNDPKAGLDYDNLRLIRAFENGLHPDSSEAGFVLVHIEMAKNSGPLVAGTVKCLEAAGKRGADGSLARDRAGLAEGLAEFVGALQKINRVMDTMWSRSRPLDYTTFRTFIFGIASQSMFPNGVVYKGVEDDKPQSFRGESGANDSMIPLMDNLLQIPMPQTPLTEILRDFRQYRPSNHKAFLLHVNQRSLELDLRAFALGLSKEKSEELEDEEGNLLQETRALWLQVLDQVRDFRWRHWCFAKEYILKQTQHPTATGGSPIVTWLPNQLAAVLDEMKYVYEACGGAEGRGLGKACEEIMETVTRQRATLRKEVAQFCTDRGLTDG